MYTGRKKELSLGRYLCVEYESSSFGRTATLMSNQESGWASISVYMFVVSGHLYRPLLSSQPWELEGKIKSGVGTHPLTFLGAGLSILVFFWNLSPGGSTIGCGLKNRSDTYSFVL